MRTYLFSMLSLIAVLGTVLCNTASGENGSGISIAFDQEYQINGKTQQKQSLFAKYFPFGKTSKTEPTLAGEKVTKSESVPRAGSVWASPDKKIEVNVPNFSTQNAPKATSSQISVSPQQILPQQISTVSQAPMASPMPTPLAFPAIPAIPSPAISSGSASLQPPLVSRDLATENLPTETPGIVIAESESKKSALPSFPIQKEENNPTFSLKPTIHTWIQSPDLPPASSSTPLSGQQTGQQSQAGEATATRMPSVQTTPTQTTSIIASEVPYIPVNNAPPIETAMRNPSNQTFSPVSHTRRNEQGQSPLSRKHGGVRNLNPLAGPIGNTLDKVVDKAADKAVDDTNGLDQSPVPKLISTLPAQTPGNLENEPVSVYVPQDSAIPRPSPVTEGYSIAQLQQIALQYNPTLQNKQREIRAKYGTWLQSGLYANPVVGFSGEDLSDDGTQGKQGVFVQQEIILGKKLRLAQSVESWSIQIVKREYEIAQWKVRNDVQAKCYDLLATRYLVATYSRLAAIAQESVQISDAIMQARQTGKSDFLQNRVMLNKALIELKKAELDENETWLQLVALIGQPEMSKQPITDHLLQTRRLPGHDEVLQNILTYSPEMQLEYDKKQKAACAIASEKAQGISNITVGATLSHNVSAKSTVGDFSIAMPLRLYDRNQGNVMRAQAESMMQSSEIERLQLELRQRLTGEWNNYQKSLETIDFYEKTILADAKESVDLSILGLQQGETTSLELLIAQQTYFRSLIEYIEAMRGLARSETYIEGMLLKGGLEKN